MARRSVLPLPWLLFSAGGVVAALFLPVLIFLVGIAFPLGLISVPAYVDVHGLLRHPLTLLALFGVLTLSLFHWAHRFRYGLQDGLQIKHLDKPLAAACYGAALVGTAVAAYLLWRVW
jgi:succinate dehydrogenase subunit D